jgi:hypothetical protein
MRPANAEEKQQADTAVDVSSDLVLAKGIEELKAEIK